MEDETDNDGVMDNGGIIEDSGTDNNEMAGGNINGDSMREMEIIQ